MAATTQELFDDEFTREVRDGYMRLLVRGVPDDEATDAILYEQRYSALMSPAHAALLWLALALTQARHGRHSELVHRRALRVLDDDQWLTAWVATSDAIAARRELLEAVRAELAQPAAFTPAVEIELAQRAEPLDEAHRAWIDGCRDTLRAASPDLDLGAPPDRLVREAARRLDAAREDLRRGDDDRANAHIAIIGVLWGDQLVRAAAWEWATVIDPADARTCALVRRDRSALISPFHLPAWHLEDPEGAANVLAELYHTLRLAAPAPGERGMLLSLRDFTRRLADPRWTEQREQILSGTGDARLAGAYPGGALAIPDNLDALGDTAHLTSDAPAPVPVPHDGGRRPPSAPMAARRALVLRALLDHTTAGLPRDVVALVTSGWDATERARCAPRARELSEQRVHALRTAGVWDAADDDERRTLATPVTEIEPLRLLAGSWRAEALGCVLWALGHIDAIPAYDEAMRTEVLLAVGASNGGAELLVSPVLRSREEIEHARTVAELWHWRSRTRELLEDGHPFPSTPSFPVRSWDGVVRYTAPQALERGLLGAIIDEDFAAFGRAYRDLSRGEWMRARGIAAERHFALNWLCGYAPGNRWAATPTQT